MTTLAATCVHHWLIESPNGALELRAKCRHCSKERTFPAVPETERHEAISLTVRDIGVVTW